MFEALSVAFKRGGYSTSFAANLLCWEMTGRRDVTQRPKNHEADE